MVNLVSIYLRGIVPMVKNVLSEPYLVGASRKGLQHPSERLYQWMSVLLIRTDIRGHLDRVARSNKPESGGPKGTSGKITELRDCLRVGAKTTYGNGTLIVGRLDRRRLGNKPRISDWERNGYRCYSAKAAKTKRKPRKPTQQGETKLPERLLKLAEFCKRNPNAVVPDDLTKLLRMPAMYQAAYSKLKSNPGNMTPGIKPQTLDGISLEWVQETIRQISTRKFEFQPGRRVMIPKSDGTKTRPLTIAPPRDKIVQEVLRMILEAIFEPTFSENSHGFRPMRSCHTALRQVRTQFGAASYFLEGDISKCFPSIDHRILMNIIEGKIKDRQFTALIWKALKAGYLEFHQVQNTIVGTPQGSIISPILANIYLDKLDRFMEERIAKYNKGSNAKVNPEYKRLDYLQQKARKAGNSEEALRLLKEKQRLPSRIHADPNFRRMYYVRYADDWIVAIRGPRSDVVQLLYEIKTFLETELKLELSLAKTCITKPTREAALFLGTEITISNHTYAKKGERGQYHRVPSQIRLLAPKLRIYKKLSSAGLMDLTTGKGTPRFL